MRNGYGAAQQRMLLAFRGWLLFGGIGKAQRGQAH